MQNKHKQNLLLRMTVFFTMLFIITEAAAIVMLYHIFYIPEPEGLSLASWPDVFTENFSIWLSAEDDTVSVEKIGLDRLDEYGLWLQIIDESGTEIFSHAKPETYPKEYTITELVSIVKSEYNNKSTLFISSFSSQDKTFNYIIGFPYAIGKHMLYYNGENIERLSPLVRNIILLAAAVSILCAFIYPLWLSKKLNAVTGGIRDITLRSYSPLREKGVFEEIYASLNKMDAEIGQSEKLREKTERTRKEWISNITHDLKTPLSPIKGYAELLLSGEKPPDTSTVKKYGSIILKNASHIENLVNDLKLTYQLDSGAAPYNPQKIRLTRFMKELVIDILNDPAFSERTIEFEDTDDETSADIDANLFRRAVQNIIINALVHNSPDTRVSISLQKIAEGSVSITISDNGAGMDESELEKLWDRYYRGTNTKERTDGSGLGLAIAKQIITLHGGEISVKSTVGMGTEFSIIIPAIK